MVDDAVWVSKPETLGVSLQLAWGWWPGLGRVDQEDERGKNKDHNNAFGTEFVASQSEV